MKKQEKKIIDAQGRTLGSETVEKKGLSELIRLATYQMLPANKLRKKMMINLHIED